MRKNGALVLKDEALTAAKGQIFLLRLVPNTILLLTW